MGLDWSTCCRRYDEFYGAIFPTKRTTISNLWYRSIFCGSHRGNTKGIQLNLNIVKMMVPTVNYWFYYCAGGNFKWVGLGKWSEQCKYSESEIHRTNCWSVQDIGDDWNQPHRRQSIFQNIYGRTNRCATFAINSSGQYGCLLCRCGHTSSYRTARWIRK